MAGKHRSDDVTVVEECVGTPPDVSSRDPVKIGKLKFLLFLTRINTFLTFKGSFENKN